MRPNDAPASPSNGQLARNKVSQEPTAQDKTPQDAPVKKNWRETIIDAKGKGASDEVAAQLAKISLAELEHRLEIDKALDRDMRAARAQAFLDHLESINRASQWQAHQYMIEKFFPEQLPREISKADTPLEREIDGALSKMTPEQLKHPGVVIEQGINAVNEQRVKNAMAK